MPESLGGIVSLREIGDNVREPKELYNYQIAEQLREFAAMDEKFNNYGTHGREILHEAADRLMVNPENVS